MALRLWKADDDAWEEHARWQPLCGFVRQKKGDAFIQSIKEKYATVSSFETCHTHTYTQIPLNIYNIICMTVIISNKTMSKFSYLAYNIYNNCFIFHIKICSSMPAHFVISEIVFCAVFDTYIACKFHQFTHERPKLFHDTIVAVV